MNNVAKKIVKILVDARIEAIVSTNRDGSITIDTASDIAARDALGLKRFRDYVDGVEVVIV